MKHQETGDYIEEADELILRCVNDLSLAIISAEQQKEFYLLLVCNVFDIWSFKQVMLNVFNPTNSSERKRLQKNIHMRPLSI